ncbi:MAG: hypothetical protein R6U70_06060 [Bacillota bacterium]
MNYARSQRRIRLALYSSIVVLSAAALAGALLPFHPGHPPTDPVDSSAATALTTRLGGSDLSTTAIAVSRAAYPLSGAAGAVILVPEGDWMTGLIAATLAAAPVNAPILPVPRGPMPAEIEEEIRRLSPRGINWDGGIQILALGQIDGQVIDQIDRIGLTCRHIDASTAAELAERVDHYRAILTGNHPDQVLIVSADAAEFALIAASWAAHSGHPVLFVENRVLPRATRRALDLRPADAFVYVLAPEEAVPEALMDEMSFFGCVQRIPGGDPFEMAAAFARYTDRGADFRWWLGANPRVFGPGVSGPGQNLIFVDIDEPMGAAVAAGLSQRGAHGPLLWVQGDRLPDPVEQLLAAIRPAGGRRLDPLFNRGWLIGDEDAINPRTRQLIEDALRAADAEEAIDVR